MSNRYVRFATMPLASFLPLIEADSKERINVSGHLVGNNSLRLQTFKVDGTMCRHCGLQATHFAIEGFHKNPETSKHVNLWAWDPVRKEDVLFTSDHILAKSKGGSDGLENRQTLCSPCNGRKGQSENPLHKVKKGKKE